MRVEALSWCARNLCAADVTGAERLVVAAGDLERSPELDVAEAVVAAAKGDYRGALTQLADLDSPCARTAALIAVARHKGKPAATEWMRTSGWSPADLDPEGRLVVLTIELDLAHWESAADIARMVTTDGHARCASTMASSCDCSSSHYRARELSRSRALSVATRFGPGLRLILLDGPSRTDGLRGTIFVGRRQSQGNWDSQRPQR